MTKYLLIGLGLLAPFLFWLTMFNYVEQGEAGLTWNPFTGELGMQQQGMHISSPLMRVAIIETRPQRVCITSTAQAAPNCQLVQFDETLFREFVAVEGWRYYWLSNRISFNSGHTETYRGFHDVLRGYAFSAKPYRFIKRMKTL